MALVLRGFFIVVLLAVAALPALANPDVDDDGDGWTENQGDCCDVASDGCTEPALVNPGAFEIEGNFLDDDCDGTVDEAPAVCDALLASDDPDPLSYAKAMDLCRTTTEEGLGWGVIDGAFLLADGTGSPNPVSRSIRTSFGNNGAQAGTAFTVLSTGSAAATSQTLPPFTAFQPGRLNETSSAFPADWFAANGNVVPVLPGCPPLAGATTVDPVMLKLRIRVPTNARSFRLRTRFFGAEYPEWMCSPFNDVYLVLLDSAFTGSYANPADKNIATYGDPLTGPAYPIGVNLGHNNATTTLQACKNGSTGCATGAVAGTTATCTGTTDLTGTGFERVNPPPAFASDPGYCSSNNLLGGATAWLSAGGNVVPGETIELRFVLWDTADGYYDSVVLLDDFQWSADYTTPGAFLPGDVPAPAPPSPPAGVAATAQSASSVEVTWTSSPLTSTYELFRRGPAQDFVPIATPAGTSFTDTVSAGTAYLYRVRARNEIGSSPDSDSDLATTVVFSNDPLEAGVTPVQAGHLAQLRSAANAVRQLAGLDPAGFTDDASPGVLVKALHVTQIRAALDAALDFLGLPAGNYTDPALDGEQIKAAHVQEVRDRVR